MTEGDRDASCALELGGAVLPASDCGELVVKVFVVSDSDHLVKRVGDNCSVAHVATNVSRPDERQLRLALKILVVKPDAAALLQQRDGKIDGSPVAEPVC